MPSAIRPGVPARALLLLAGAIVAMAGAAPPPPAAQVEIDVLMSRLEASACQFNRNGTWHSAADARAHLRRKLKYFEEKGTVQSAEEFIERAASASSMTGEPYLVRCGDGAAIPSAAWLRSELKALRSSARLPAITR